MGLASQDANDVREWGMGLGWDGMDLAVAGFVCFFSKRLMTKTTSVKEVFLLVINQIKSDLFFLAGASQKNLTPSLIPFSGLAVSR